MTKQCPGNSGGLHVHDPDTVYHYEVVAMTHINSPEKLETVSTYSTHRAALAYANFANKRALAIRKASNYRFGRWRYYITVVYTCGDRCFA